jgi:hypothetical protein
MQRVFYTEAELVTLLKLNSAQVERLRDSMELAKYTSGLDRLYAITEVKKLLASTELLSPRCACSCESRASCRILRNSRVAALRFSLDACLRSSFKSSIGFQFFPHCSFDIFALADSSRLSAPLN